MTEPIGRADYELGADRSKLKKDLADAKADIARSGQEAEAEATSRSSKWGAALAAGAKTGVKVVATATAGLLGVATKGALQLQGVMDRYQADTGATAEEARRAGKVINKVAGDNRLSLESVADAAAKLRTDFGLVGEEADALTAAFARYGRVTKQEAGAAVSDFDDILDSWGLTAADAQGLMDKLIVSHQRFGGSVTDSQKTLAALAPAMRAANFEIDDAIALLNLFGAKGIDANTASAAFAKALTKVKSPAELKKLIDDISATEDPFKRATLAGDLFGARAGAKLGNALAGAHLDDYALSMEEVAGATDKANDVLDQSFPAQLQKKISQFGASLRELGTDWGPAITGAASFASVLGALGLDTALSKAWKGAAGSSAIQAAARFAGDKAASGYLRVLIAGDAISAAASAGWKKVAGSGAVMSAAQLAGTKAGLAFSAAASAALLVAPIVVTYVLGQAARGERDKEVEEIKLKVAAILAENASVEKLQAAIKQLSTEAMIARRSTEGPSGFIADLFGTKESLAAEADALEAQVKLLQSHLTNSLGEHGGRDIGQGWTSGIVSGMAGAAPAIAKVFAGPTTAALIAGARKAGSLSGTALAAGILSARQAPVDAFNTLKEMLKNAMSPAAEVARLNGELMSKALRRGFKSGDPAVRAQAAGTAKIAADRLGELAVGGGKAGRDAMHALDRGMRSKIPAVRAASLAAKNAAVEKLKAAKDQAATAGQKAGEAFAAALRRAVAAGDFHVNASVGFTLPGHAAGGWVGLHGPEVGVYGEKGPEYVLRNDEVRAIAAITRGIGSISGAASAMSAAATAPRGAPATVHAGVNMSGATFHLHGIGSDVSPAAAKRFGQSVLDEVAYGLREQSARSVLTGGRRA